MNAIRSRGVVVHRKSSSSNHHRHHDDAGREQEKLEDSDRYYHHDKTPSKKRLSKSRICISIILFVTVVLVIIVLSVNPESVISNKDVIYYMNYLNDVASAASAMMTSGSIVSTSTTTTAVTNPKLTTSTVSSSSSQQQQQRPKSKATIAYVVSFIECTDRHKSGETTIGGLIDASLVLRHSVHVNSIRNFPYSHSVYDYHMYALIHRTKAISCQPAIEKAGFTTVLVDIPIDQTEIKGDELRKTIQREVCCGIDEFIKLYAYTHFSKHPLIVHLDIDFIFQKPMDDIFDVMLMSDNDDDRNKEYNNLLSATELEQAKLRIDREDNTESWPNNIQAAITRDYHSSYGEGRISGFQAGFWIVKPSQQHFNNLINIIREGNYTGGHARNNGWGGLGYGGFVGAKAMQGLIAYYYDIHVPGTWLELNNCRHNAILAVVTKNGKCRSNRPSCEDCRYTPIQNISSIHYTACRKPWGCCASKWVRGVDSGPQRKYKIPTDIVNYDQCMKAQSVWHHMRKDLEDKLYMLTKDERIRKSQQGPYNADFFLGHCQEDESKGYLRIAGGVEELLGKLPEIYR